LIADASSKMDNIKVDNLDLNANTLSTTNTNGELVLTPHGTAGVGILAGGSTTSGALKLYEGSANGSHSITVKAPTAVTANVTLTLPDGDGDANNMLTTNGSGVLAWSSTVNGTTDTSPTIDVYYKVIGPDDNLQFNDIGWTLATIKKTVQPDATDYKEYEYNIEALEEFTGFSIKLVLQSSDSANPPLVENFRAIALST